MVPPGELYSEIYTSLSWVINSGLLAVLAVLTVLAVALLFIWQWCFTVNRFQWIKVSRQPVAMAAVTLCREEKWNNNNDNNSFSLLKTVVQNSQGHLTENQWQKEQAGRLFPSTKTDLWFILRNWEISPLIIAPWWCATTSCLLSDPNLRNWVCFSFNVRHPSSLPPSSPPSSPGRCSEPLWFRRCRWESACWVSSGGIVSTCCQGLVENSSWWFRRLRVRWIDRPAMAEW